MSAMSAKTALAVGIMPAPLPVKRTSPTASPSSRTALYSLRILPSWESFLTMTGETDAYTTSLRSLLTARSFMLQPSRPAYLKSKLSTVSMPFVSIAFHSSFFWNAMVDSMESFLAASRPRTSLEGSASAKPSSWASFSASPYCIPSSSIFVSMKLVVPLRMAVTLSMLLPTRQSLTDLRMGMPPPTLASNLSSTPFDFAISRSSAPCSAIRSLFAVTTCFLDSSDLLT